MRQGGFNRLNIFCRFVPRDRIFYTGIGERVSLPESGQQSSFHGYRDLGLASTHRVQG